MRRDENTAKKRREAREARREAKAKADRQLVETRQRARLGLSLRIAAAIEAAPRTIGGGNG